MDIYEIIRRWHAGQKITYIAAILKYDRKTVRHYITSAKSNGISKEQALPDKSSILKTLQDITFKKKSVKPSFEILLPYKNEIIDLVNQNRNPLIPKISFEVICDKYDLTGKVSYSSFKRFYNTYCSDAFHKTITCRLEHLPGSLTQIDYAKMGVLYDQIARKRRSVYSFIATLAHSRHKFIEFVWAQDQKSFIRSHILMFDYFGGITERISIDNLKAGVIKPDLYDPTFNRLYQEIAEYYGFFIDPCRIRKPKDKPIVERDVKSVRNQFRKYAALYPNLTIKHANELIRNWCIHEYGQKSHGTTGEKPYQVFKDIEQVKLKKLPLTPFQLADWKQAKVHPDCYIQYQRRFYSIPYQYIGKKVWIKATDKVLYVYFNEELIKQHLITSKGRQTDFNDFPGHAQAALDDKIPTMLISKAYRVGPYYKKMVENLLKIHAFINLRKAQGLISLIDSYPKNVLEKCAQYIIDKNIKVNFKDFKLLLHNFSLYENDLSGITISDQTKEFVREIDYFKNS